MTTIKDAEEALREFNDSIASDGRYITDEAIHTIRILLGLAMKPPHIEGLERSLSFFEGNTPQNANLITPLLEAARRYMALSDQKGEG